MLNLFALIDRLIYDFNLEIGFKSILYLLPFSLLFHLFLPIWILGISLILTNTAIIYFKYSQRYYGIPLIPLDFLKIYLVNRDFLARLHSKILGRDRALTLMIVKDILFTRQKSTKYTIIYDLEYLDGLFLDIYRSHQSQPSPVIVLFYGKEWNTGLKSNYATFGKTLALAGYTVVIPNISAYPKATATEMQVQILLVIKFVQTQIGHYNSDPGDITIIGYGRGAQLLTNVVFKNAIGAAEYHYLHSSDDLEIEVPRDPNGIDLSNCILICQDGVYNLGDLIESEKERGVEDLTLTNRLFDNDYCSPVDTLLEGSREHPNDILSKHLPHCFGFLEEEMDVGLLDLLEYVGVLDVSWLKSDDLVYRCRMGERVLGDYVTRVRKRCVELERYKRWSVMEKVADIDDLHR